MIFLGQFGTFLLLEATKNLPTLTGFDVRIPYSESFGNKITYSQKKK